MIAKIKQWWRERGQTSMRPDYRAFDMRKMKHWGNNAFWWPERRAGEKACIFASPGPRPGDVLIGKTGKVYIIQEEGLENPSNPGDQYFVNVVDSGITELPPSLRKYTVSDDLV